MISNASAFLQTIIASPDDDAPRLVFADWLEEQGEPERAEFIRVQCELTKIPKFDGVTLIAPFKPKLENGEWRLWAEIPETEIYFYQVGHNEIGIIGEIGKLMSLPVRFGKYQAQTYIEESHRNSKHRTLEVMLVLIPEIEDPLRTGGPANVRWFWEHGDVSEMLRERERELLAKHEMDWLDNTFPDYVVGYDAIRAYILVRRGNSAERGRIDLQWHRGFVESIACTWADWLGHHTALMQATPLREVTLTTGRFQTAILKSLRERWPGIKFTLPPVIGYWEESGPVVPVGTQRRMRSGQIGTWTGVAWEVA